MRLVIFSVVFILSSVIASPTPQVFGGYQPWSWLQSSLQQFQNNFPRPQFFQPGIWNRPGGQIQVTQNPSQQPVVVQSIIPPQSNAQWTQTNEIPNRQVNGWFWQNWMPSPFIQQYPPDQPTVIIISHGTKSPLQTTTDASTTALNEPVVSGNANAVQSSSNKLNETTVTENAPMKIQSSTVNTTRPASTTVPLTSGKN